MGAALSNYKQLCTAVEEGDIEVVQQAIDAGVEISVSPNDDEGSLLYRAVVGGHSEVVRLLTESPAIKVNVGTRTETPLHCAVRLGDVLSCDHLLRGKASCTTVPPGGRYTPLYTAVRTGQPSIVRMLLKAGCDPEKFQHVGPDVKNSRITVNEGTTALHCAIQEHSINLCELLCQYGADVNRADSYGRTCVHLAVREGSISLTRLCLLYGGKVSVVDNDNTTPLHIAVNQKYKEIFQLILDDGCDVNVGRKGHNAPGHTPLHDAIKIGDPDMVQKLCQYGADLNRRTTYGITPPMMACELGLMDLMAVMLHVDQHQHNVKPLDPNIQDECGATMLINAVKRRNGELCKMILSSATYHQADSGNPDTCMVAVDFDLFDNHGKAAIHYAIEKGQTFIAEQLLVSGARYDLRDRHGCAPLQYCLSGGHTLAAFVLLRHGHPLPVSECEVVQMIQLATLPHHSAVLQLLVYLGWRPHSVGVTQLTSFLGRCIDSASDVVPWMEREVREPISLCRLSRLPAREYIARKLGYRSIVETVNKLSIPSRVKEALLLDDVKATWSFTEELILDEADVNDGHATRSL